mmetsp:Transcript_48845/g.153402  ORF Transcript_48845/g.153402 Transcript_48845/m.153402 type:complete len:95 (+) Transcript_48845:862-1146(+)
MKGSESEFSFSSQPPLKAASSYGEVINPIADVLIIGRSWCVSRPSAELLLSVPTCAMDYIHWRDHRCYGKRMLQRLTGYWKSLSTSRSTVTCET